MIGHATTSSPRQGTAIPVSLVDGTVHLGDGRKHSFSHKDSLAPSGRYSVGGKSVVVSRQGDELHLTVEDGVLQVANGCSGKHLVARQLSQGSGWGLLQAPTQH